MEQKEKLDMRIIKIIERIAQTEGVAVKDVLDAMQEALMAGRCNTDPAVQDCWKQIPTNGEILTPEEFIIWAAQKINEQRRKNS